MARHRVPAWEGLGTRTSRTLRSPSILVQFRVVSPMAKPRLPGKVKQPWKSEDELKRAVLDCCEEKFSQMFGRPWDPSCKSGLLAQQRSLFEQDQQARELWEELRRVVRKIGGFLEREKLWPITLDNLSGITPRAGSLAFWFDQHGRSVRTAEQMAVEVPPFPESIRGFVVQLWEFVDPRNLPHQSKKPAKVPAEQKPLSRWKRGPDNQTRELTVPELTVISLLCGSWPKISSEDLHSGIPVSSVIDRERKNIAHAVKHRPRGPM